ncbi:MAG: S-methyl-5-thioribose-1-phosphate isomerase [Syntrophothermus sp.]|uniref:S-methyl-5-thioribose-1-phosphate isomerase n=1 Tax=Syntrophothermus sp. TaxID=2736299 RepID=UPI0025811DDA|nr:S-methyl-5-thioribose-1-phosphate isomerase [Syntrophothermus sp.]NSW81975.1 S-methyl-5-thioribose-1-phosphate isomerase [Syntrophothermus sp.]
MQEPLLMDLRNNVYLEDDSLVIIDRRKLPTEQVPVVCRNYEEVARAIEDMVVQGAGDIAITAGYGLYLATKALERQGKTVKWEKLEPVINRLKSTRPTGFHLAALLDRLKRDLAETNEEKEIPLSNRIQQYLETILDKQKVRSEKTGREAESLLKTGETVLTHCFAGPALFYMLRYARGNGKDVKVMCTETRPYLQGARLTAWSVSQLGVDTTLITDNMAAHFMSQGLINRVFVAADRVAIDGVVANKVGTLQLAIVANYYGIPFHVLGYGGPDRRTRSGQEIPIEYRDPSEVLEFRGIRITGPEVKAVYPAFDLTPPQLVTSIITDKGIFRPENINDYWTA